MAAQGDSREATSSRDKVLKVFGYLKALNEHRNPAKRNIKDHAWSFLLDELPDHPAVQRTLRRKESTDEKLSETSQPDSNVILRVRRLQLTQCPSPPESVLAWLNRGWEHPRNVEIQWIESHNEIDNEGETIIVYFQDDEERVDLALEWSRKRDQWRTNEMPARRAMRTFEQLYELHGRIERDSERLDRQA